HRYFIIYKPYQVLSQFTSEGGKLCLADVCDVAKDVYPVGRLDYDSEGLLILTNDTKLNHLLLDPKHKHEREYWVQIEGLITQEALKQLRSGITISVDGKEYKTAQSKADLFETSPIVAERRPPIRFRKNIPVSWISLSLIEGKNRQVRRMTAKVGFPTLRLIRYRIEKITIQGLLPGDIRELSKQEIYKRLSL
ncbi:MAG TPA: pseudouridine synthase, partial [Segetibacter sp.]|nr:pseudouridine synthase [Segetibacter sp.]